MKTHTSNFCNNIKFELKITLSYFIFGLLWILFSDIVLELVLKNDSLLTEFQMYKGAFFVCVTSAFLYLLVRSHMQSLRKAESQLRESEFKFNKLYENGPFGMVLTNVDFKFINTNAAFCTIVGYSEAELLELSLKDISNPDDLIKDLLNISKLIDNELSIYKTEKRYIRKDGQVIWGSLTVIPYSDNNGQFLYNLGIIEDITNRKRAEIALNNSELELRKFASHLQHVREEEKVALAREIHDDLGQILVVLKIEMGLMKRMVIKNNSFVDAEEILNKFDSLVALIDKTIKTTRRIMNGLRPELLELHGLVAAIKVCILEFDERQHLKCEFSNNMLEDEIDEQQKLVLYRILQEALNNIAKHSKATLVTIQLNREADTLILEITDNGIGFNKNKSGRPDSYGMIGMKERVVLLKGKLEITSQPNKGTCVKVEIPCDNR